MVRLEGEGGIACAFYAYCTTNTAKKRRIIRGKEFYNKEIVKKLSTVFLFKFVLVKESSKLLR